MRIMGMPRSSLRRWIRSRMSAPSLAPIAASGSSRSSIFGGSGADTISGSVGDDEIHVNDGEGDDVVDCGEGLPGGSDNDTVLFDSGDQIASNCEVQNP